MTNWNWPDGCFGNRPLPTFSNTRAAVMIALDCQYNEFAEQAYVRAPFYGGAWVPLSDELISATRLHFIDEFNADFRPTNIVQAIQSACWERRVDPVADYVRELRWDGVARVDRWLSTYADAPDTDYTSAVGRCLLMTMVRRVLSPGCKADNIFVFVGPQRAGKSSLARILAGDASMFTDQDVIGLPVREQQEALRGRWVVEASELGGMDRQSVEKVKAFASRTHDRARPAYGRIAVDQPRRFTVIMTTNEQHFLKDTTGNRRFCIVRVNKVDLLAVERDRAQLLAEAVVLQSDGSPLDIKPTLYRAAARVQERYLECDPLDELLAGLEGTQVGGESRIAWSDVWDCVGYPIERRTQSVQRRLIGCMRRLGWEHSTRPFRVRDQVFRGFLRPAPRRTPTDAPSTRRKTLTWKRNT